MRPRAIALAVLGAIQLAIPGTMIFQQEQTLRLGSEYKFQTEPVDPYDLFRGRYVALRFQCETVKVKSDAPEAALTVGTAVYVAVKPDDAGFAEVERVSAAPIAGDNVFQAKVQSVGNAWGGLWGRPSLTDVDSSHKQIRLAFPFNKYFMDEARAAVAEQAYRAGNGRNSRQRAWAAVRLRHGKAALEDLFIEAQPIRDYLRDHPRP